MKEIKLPSGEYLLVESAKTSTYKIYGNQLFRYWNGFIQDSAELPSGNWQIVGKADSLSEDDWKKITSGMWDISGKWILLDDYREPKSIVTHWAYMPEPPTNLNQ